MAKSSKQKSTAGSRKTIAGRVGKNLNDKGVHSGRIAAKTPIHTPSTPPVDAALIKRNIGQSIRRIREAANFSQELVAERAELHPIYYGNVERGKNNISIISLAQIARALDCTVGDIIKGSEI